MRALHGATQQILHHVGPLITPDAWCRALLQVDGIDIPVVGGHAGTTIVPLLSQATPGGCECPSSIHSPPGTCGPPSDTTALITSGCG